VTVTVTVTPQPQAKLETRPVHWLTVRAAAAPSHHCHTYRVPPDPGPTRSAVRSGSADPFREEPLNFKSQSAPPAFKFLSVPPAWAVRRPVTARHRSDVPCRLAPGRLRPFVRSWKPREHSLRHGNR
jgi:hypothetical protein